MKRLSGRAEWGHVFGDETIAAAVLDRSFHQRRILVIHGESYSLKQPKKAGLLPQEGRTTVGPVSLEGQLLGSQRQIK